MLCFLYIATTLLFLAQHHHQACSTSTFVYAGCSPSKFQENTQYQTNLNSLFSSIATTASRTIYNSFTTGTDSPPGNVVYGLYQCRGDLDTPSCASCIQNAIGQLSLVCSYAFSASLQLDSCFIRYSNNNFLGQNDTTLAYRRCSTSTSNDADFVRRRDDVLADLQSGDGFRVTSSGLVQGYAQCIGDLASADCTTCLAEAVSQLRNSCGSAKAADVYLAQCYARYWASGYYFHSPSGTQLHYKITDDFTSSLLKSARQIKQDMLAEFCCTFHRLINGGNQSVIVRFRVLDSTIYYLDQTKDETWQMVVH